jgi:5-methylcytosine-specific restriction protein A
MGWHKTSRHQRGYGSAWVKTRTRILKRDSYLCQPCLAKGRPTAATQVDHINARSKGGTEDDENLQAICDDCHEAKTLAEAAEAAGRKSKPRTKYDQSGRPVW